MSTRPDPTLLALLDGLARGTEANALVLADWLEEQGDQRADVIRKRTRRYLATKRQVAARPDPGPRLFRALVVFQSAILDLFPEWLEVVAERTVYELGPVPMNAPRPTDLPEADGA